MYYTVTRAYAEFNEKGGAKCPPKGGSEKSLGVPRGVEGNRIYWLLFNDGFNNNNNNNSVNL